MLMKLVVLAAVIGAVIFAYRIIDRRIKVGGNARTRGKSRPADDPQLMARCTTCKTYVPTEGASRCERADCPYPA